MEDYELSVNTEEVAEPLDTAEVTSEVTEPTNEETAETVVEESHPRQQTAEENAIFAEMRRKHDAETQAIKAQNDRLLQALNAYGYDGSPEEIADTLMAQTQNITVEEAKEQREAIERENQQITQLQGENEYFRNIAIEKLKADDLSKIKEAYPEIKAKHLDELGDDFFKALNATNDPVLAYDVINAKKQRETKPTPPEIGGVNNSSSKEKDFYTSQEVDNLTEKDYSNPKIMEIVRKSMLKWR